MPRELPFPVFDADNHLYETREALTKFLPENRKRLIDYVEVRGRTKIVVRGHISEYIRVEIPLATRVQQFHYRGPAAQTAGDGLVRSGLEVAESRDPGTVREALRFVCRWRTYLSRLSGTRPHAPPTPINGGNPISRTDPRLHFAINVSAAKVSARLVGCADSRRSGCRTADACCLTDRTPPRTTHIR